jgi:predicted CxxxxCH...CXXCH cytochrome family protein
MDHRAEDRSRKRTRRARDLLIGRCAAVVASLLIVGGCMVPRDPPLEGTTPACDGCHGSAESEAPPPGLWLEGSKSATTERGVGAHAVHLTPGSLAGVVPCASCHVVPAEVDDPGHMDDALPAEVVFSGLALARKTKAAWDGQRCTVYCHAGKEPGGKVTRPRWTLVDGTQKACDACHGDPPSGKNHPQVSNCDACHGKVVDAKKVIIDLQRHIDGKVDVDDAKLCNACHGSTVNDAPPQDTQGNTAVTARGVGVHQAHVKGSANHAGMACNECHLTPTAVADPGHTDTSLPAEVTFGKVATGAQRSLGRKPVWDTTALTCASTYCHDLVEGGAPKPSWNKAQAMVCGSCHGLPPTKTLEGAVHAPSTLADCKDCHPAVVDDAGKIINPKLHVNGVVNLNN